MQVQAYPKHDEDFYSWAMTTAELLKNKQYHEVDMDSVIEELESMGGSEKRALISCLAELLLHLLKWQYQSSLRGTSWEISIAKQRINIRRILKQNPGLKSFLDEALLDAYEDAVGLAVKETQLNKKTFPAMCPYTFEQLMDEAFYPD